MCPAGDGALHPSTSFWCFASTTAASPGLGIQVYPVASAPLLSLPSASTAVTFRPYADAGLSPANG